MYDPGVTENRWCVVSWSMISRGLDGMDTGMRLKEMAACTNFPTKTNFLSDTPNAHLVFFHVCGVRVRVRKCRKILAQKDLKQEDRRAGLLKGNGRERNGREGKGREGGAYLKL